MEFEKMIDKVYKDKEDRRQFFTHNQMMFAAVNKENKFVFFSDSWLKCLKLKPEELRDINFTLLIHPDDLERSLDAYDFYKETGKFAIKMFHNRYRRSDGTYASIQWFGGEHDEELELSLTSAFELPADYEPFNWRV